MARPKVYGRKMRNIAVAENNVFIASSSGPESSPGPATVLSERSHNAQILQHDCREKLSAEIGDASSSKASGAERSNIITRSATPKKSFSGSSKEPRPRKDCPGKSSPEPASPPKPNVTTRSSSPLKAPNEPQRDPKPRRGRPKTHLPSHPPTPTHDLHSTFQALTLSKQPPSPRTPPPQIPIHPAPVTASILTHLSPLLTLKSLSPTIESFPHWLSARAHLSLVKIGEGSFGEVYRATSPSPISTTTSSSSSPPPSSPSSSPTSSPSSSPPSPPHPPPPLRDPQAPPPLPPRGPGSRSYTSPGSAARELRLLARLSRVPGFVEFRGACVLQGAMPARLCALWEEYRAAGRTVESRNPRAGPGGRGWGRKQLWLVVEMSDAGEGLERGGYRPGGGAGGREGGRGGKGGERYLSVRRTWDLWWGVVRAVAKAEVWCGFEHRDLHLGNVCARDRVGDGGEADEEDLGAVGEEGSVVLGLNRTGVEITLIDYSLSRARVGGEGSEVLFYDFVADRELLEGEGDLQYDMYRHMAGAVGERGCGKFVPETNVVWLWFLLRRLLDVTVELSDEAKRRRNGKITVVARTRRILEELLTLIDPETMSTWWIHSAGELLDMGVERLWFMPDEILNA